MVKCSPLPSSYCTSSKCKNCVSESDTKLDSQACSGLVDDLGSCNRIQCTLNSHVFVILNSKSTDHSALSCKNIRALIIKIFVGGSIHPDPFPTYLETSALCADISIFGLCCALVISVSTIRHTTRQIPN